VQNAIGGLTNLLVNYLFAFVPQKGFWDSVHARFKIIFAENAHGVDVLELCVPVGRGDA
jgi:hypothetical protein